jgi:hypothetical protein
VNRRRSFILSCVGAAIILAAYVALTPPRPGSNVPPGASPNQESETFEAAAAVPEPPFILFRNATAGTSFGRIAVAAVAAVDQRRIAPLSCERVHYAAGWGVCLTTDGRRMPVAHAAVIFDRSFTPRHTVALTGPPIRARVSPDGRRAATTVFESGHSYADAAFSTRTTLIETSSGRPIADLEEFAIERDGRPFKAADFNFWGVTFFRDGDRFFATLKTGGQTFLIQGSIDARRAAVVRSGMECPSLSPDGSLLVYKKPIEHDVGWRLHVLELATGNERALNQISRSIDDQVDWFDDRQVLYHDSAEGGTGVWVLPVDGVSPPRLLLSSAYSPAVQR